MTRLTILTGLLGLSVVSVASTVQTRPRAAPALKNCHGEYEGGQVTYTCYVSSDGQRVRRGSFETVHLDQGDIAQITYRYNRVRPQSGKK